MNGTRPAILASETTQPYSAKVIRATLSCRGNEVIPERATAAPSPREQLTAHVDLRPGDAGVPGRERGCDSSLRVFTKGISAHDHQGPPSAGGDPSSSGAHCHPAQRRTPTS